MEHALDLADKCWGKAMAVEPEFVERYLELAEELLTNKPVVLGDEFREYCRKNLVFRPANLHPNVWVSGVRALEQIGWILKMGKVEPTQSHNHMPSVTMWKSTIFGKDSDGTDT
jgi:hypothetical protein